MGKSLTSLALLLMATVASAYDYRAMPLESRVAEADLVAYAEALDPACCSFDGKPLDADDMAAFRILTALKGKPSGVVLVRHHVGLVEADPDCCLPGRKYLVFLKEVSGSGYFLLVNDKYGLYLLGSD